MIVEGQLSREREISHSVIIIITVSCDSAVFAFELIYSMTEQMLTKVF